MWSDLAADARFYSALRWPGRQQRWRRALIWLGSRGLWVLALHRFGYHHSAWRARRGRNAGTIAARIVLALIRWPIVVISKCEVADAIDTGPGVYLSDRGFLILGPKSIGTGTLIHHRVTIGVRAGSDARPTIGDNVWIGPDCVIYGDVSLGDGATTLPGSVVSMSVPPGAVAGGNPATIVRRQFDNGPLRRTLATDIDPQSLVAK
jgi:serine acetyltransferase